MPSSLSLTESSPVTSPSHAASSMASARSWSSSSFVSRPSPYGADRQVRKTSRRSNEDVQQSRSEGLQRRSFTENEKEIIASASDDFKAASCMSNVWEEHCDHRVRMAGEAIRVANREAARSGRPTLAVTGAAKGKVSHLLSGAILRGLLTYLGRT